MIRENCVRKRCAWRPKYPFLIALSVTVKKATMRTTLKKSIVLDLENKSKLVQLLTA